MHFLSPIRKLIQGFFIGLALVFWSQLAQADCAELLRRLGDSNESLEALINRTFSETMAMHQTQVFHLPPLLNLAKLYESSDATYRETPARRVAELIGKMAVEKPRSPLPGIIHNHLVKPVRLAVTRDTRETEVIFHAFKRAPSLMDKVKLAKSLISRNYLVPEVVTFVNIILSGGPYTSVYRNFAPGLFALIGKMTIDEPHFQLPRLLNPKSDK